MGSCTDPIGETDSYAARVLSTETMTVTERRLALRGIALQADAELDELRADYERACSLVARAHLAHINAVKMCDAYAEENQRISDERDTARAQLAAVTAERDALRVGAVDAERYLWLRDGALTNTAATVAMWESNSCEELDAAIDAARKQS
jgi:hypothetical protein